MIEGENFCILQGILFYPTYKIVGDNWGMYRASLGIPIPGDTRYQFVRVLAWGKLADSLNELNEKAYVKIHGHIENGSYMAPCKQCSYLEKRYTTDIVIDNFITLEEI